MKPLTIIVFAAMLLTPVLTVAQMTVGFLVGAGGIGDESYNDMTLAGLADAKRDYNVRIIHELSDESAEDTRRALDRLIAENADIIVSNRITHPEVLYRCAARFPGKYFIFNDMPWKGQSNSTSLGYANHEGAFVVGALAGWMTRSGIVAFIGGNHLPVIESFRIGFSHGVRYANSKADIIEAHISRGRDPSGFSNPRKGYQTAMALYARGADIVFVAAGLSGNGVIQAAKESDRFVIGVDTDQDHMAKGKVLTSMMKRLDKATYSEVSAIIENRFQPGLKFYGLKEGGVGLSPMRYTRHLIPQAVLNSLEETEKKIISGKIQVPMINYLKAKQAVEKKP